MVQAPPVSAVEVSDIEKEKYDYYKKLIKPK